MQTLGLAWRRHPERFPSRFGPERHVFGNASVNASVTLALRQRNAGVNAAADAIYSARRRFRVFDGFGLGNSSGSSSPFACGET